MLTQLSAALVDNGSDLTSTEERPIIDLNNDDNKFPISHI